MRTSKFTDSQIMDAVKRVEAGFAVPDVNQGYLDQGQLHVEMMGCG